MQAGPSTLFGDGWRAVESFNDVEDIDEYETDEEVWTVTESTDSSLYISGDLRDVGPRAHA